MSDFTQAPKKIILDLINEANAGLNLLETQVEFGVPAVETGSRNTSLELTAVVGGPYLGARAVYYDRLDLAAVIATGPAGRFAKTGAITTIAHVVAAINSEYAINLTEDDFEITDTFPEFENVPNEEHSITITAKPGSLVFIGSAEITLFLPQVDLEDALAVNTLDGLTYEPPVGDA